MKYNYHIKGNRFFINELELTNLEVESLSEKLNHIATSFPKSFYPSMSDNMIAAFYGICSIPEERALARRRTLEAKGIIVL